MKAGRGDDELSAFAGRATDNGADRLYGNRGDDQLDVRDNVSGNDTANAGQGLDACRIDPVDLATNCESITFF